MEWINNFSFVSLYEPAILLAISTKHIIFHFNWDGPYLSVAFGSHTPETHTWHAVCV